MGTPPSLLKRNRLEALERRHGSRLLKSASDPSSPSLLKNAVPPRHKSADPIYAPLPETILAGQLGDRMQDEDDAVNKLLRELWSNNPKANRDLDGTISKTLNQVVFLDNPTTHRMVTEKARARAQQKSRRSTKHLSLAQHRRLGSFILDQKYRSYELYAPLHTMWKVYINKLISGTCSDAVLQSRMLTADLHGAPLEVVDCLCKSFVGVKGIMVRETENTFGIVMASDRFRVVPKEGSIFVFQHAGLKVTYFGNNLSLRSTQTKAKKLKPTVELK